MIENGAKEVSKKTGLDVLLSGAVFIVVNHGARQKNPPFTVRREGDVIFFDVGRWSQSPSREVRVSRGSLPPTTPTANPNPPPIT